MKQGLFSALFLKKRYIVKSLYLELYRKPGGLSSVQEEEFTTNHTNQHERLGVNSEK